MPPRDFPTTRVSVIEGLASDDASTRSAAADLLARAYWLPIATTLQFRWRMEPADAEDLTQEFLAEALLKEWLVRFDPTKARFRTYLRMCLDRFATKAAQAAGRKKRGGDADIIALDDAVVTASTEDEADQRFRQEWVRSVFLMALDELRREGDRDGKTVHVRIFEAYDVDDAPERPSYRQLAKRFELPETTLTNHLAWARKAFRRHVLGVLRALAGSDAEFRNDVRELVGGSVE